VKGGLKMQNVVKLVAGCMVAALMALPVQAAETRKPTMTQAMTTTASGL
jgi:hypothetical protein